MPLAIPTLPETRGLSRDAVIEALRVGALPGNCPAGILADDNGALAFLVLQYIFRQADEYLPDRAGEQMLQRWADIFLPGGRKAATYAVLAATLSGPVGTVVSQGTQFSQGGILFQTAADATLGGTSVLTPISVRALTAGVVGNLPVGTALSLVAAISGVTASATVTGITSYGVDIESVDSLRDRVLFRIRKPPMGGDADDYVAWAREVPGVTRAWCAPHEVALGTVTVRFMMDDLRADLSGYPIQADCDAVAAHIATVRPVTVSDIYVVPPVPQPVNLSISNLSPDTPSTRSAALSSLSAMIKQRAAPARAVNGSLVPAQTIWAAWQSEAISAAEGIDYFDLTTTDAIMPSKGCMATLGTVAFGG
ncbi:baseplate J/gp47 family protein [Methylobacterium sp. SI9]|uniref:baseplate J/gp47 family protein n=1 Tax=Methylobacterium guangdongense TaxID=3138811 RepID=UPI00313B0866